MPNLDIPLDPKQAPLTVDLCDIEGAERENPAQCPLANAINRRLDMIEFDPGPDGESCNPTVHVFGGQPEDDAPGFIRFFHPGLAFRYMIHELDADDAEKVRTFDRTGEWNPGPVATRISEFTYYLGHTAGIPPEGLPIPEAERVLGRKLDDEIDGRTPLGEDVRGPDGAWRPKPSYPRYYCGCILCASHRQVNDIDLEDFDYDALGDPEDGICEIDDTRGA